MNSVVVPCYNEEEGMGALLARLFPVMHALQDAYEIILVDDGSSDGTWTLIKTVAEEHHQVRGIRLSRNHGHQLAISAGIAHAKGDHIFIIDADLQDPPELFPEMLAMMGKGADVVYGQRMRRHGVPLWKKAAYKVYYRILRFVSGCDIPMDAGDFRLISRRIADLIVSMPEQQRFLRGMISWLGYHQVPLLYERAPRHAGEPKYTFYKLCRLATDGIMSFSVAPLRFALLSGGLLGVIGLAAAVYLVVLKLFFAQPPQGWTSLMVVVLFIGALQLFVLGIIGEYLGRVFLESKKRPLFLVAEDTSLLH